jgi:ketosteroid isomerase-like protein
MKGQAVTIEANRALVIRFYELMSSLEFDKMFELMADDGTWTVAGNPALFHHSGTATKQQRVAALANFTKVFASLQQTVLSTTAEDDRVAAQMTTHCETHSGVVYDNEIMALIRCADGKITSIYEHLDQATSLAFEQKLASAG